MKHILLIIIGSLLISSNLSGQKNVTDQEIIKYCKVVNLTDTVSFPFSNDFRRITIDYFIKHGLQPKDYFIQNPPKGQKIDSSIYIVFFKMNALRAWYYGDKNNFHHVGGYGSPGDDIQVQFDLKFQNVLSISNSE